MQICCTSCGQRTTVSATAGFCPGCGAALAPHAAILAVKIRDVCKSFQRVRVLDRLSLSVPQGETLVIVGMSGSGKSVLIEHIIGFQQPDSGDVFIHGAEMSAEQSEEALRTARFQVGMVFQGSALIDSLTVMENVILPLVSRGTPEAECWPKAERLLAAVGLSSDVGDRMPAQLSGGMQKRAAIARALIAEPAVLLYDEPTTGLDAATSATISRLIRSVQKRQPDLTSIIITHDYVSAGMVADRVLYLDRNTGNLKDVLSREAIAAIRGEHGGETPASVSAIRDQLEEYFTRLSLHEPIASASAGETTWLSAWSNVVFSPFRALGGAALFLPKVGLPRDLGAVEKCFYDIGVRSLIVASAAGMFLGMMLTIQIARGLAGHGVFDPLPRIIGFALIERVGPLVVGLLLAGRIAASVSAEMGGRRLSRQFDALRAMAISPERYWLGPTFWGSLLALPLLTVVLEAFAMLGAYGVAIYRYQIRRRPRRGIPKAASPHPKRDGKQPSAIANADKCRRDLGFFTIAALST